MWSPRVAAAPEPIMTDPNPTVRMPIPEEPGGPTTPPPAPAPPDPATLPPPSWPAPDARTRRTRSDDGRLGSVVFGSILLGLGLWFFAEHTLRLDMPDIEWSQAWPVILIVIGAWIVLGAVRDRRS
jgi:hypothetical protein